MLVGISSLLSLDTNLGLLAHRLVKAHTLSMFLSRMGSRPNGNMVVVLLLGKQPSRE